MRKISALLLSLTFLSFSSLAHAGVYAKGLDASDYTSDFMIGDVIVSIIFVESDGTLDPDTESWDEDRKGKVLSGIQNGLNWWTEQNPTNSPLNFTYVSQTINSKYEPIIRSYYDEALWIPDVMSKIGYTGSRFTSTKDYINSLRAAYDADWGFVIFMVDSLNDSNGKLADGFFAYAYLGGPFMVMTYDNNGYGINNMDVVAAHEAGHIFHALDQYAGGGSPYTYSQGYFPTINGNHVFAQTASVSDSIMRGGIRWGLDEYAKKMIGWRDEDANGTDDIIDPAAGYNLNSGVQSSDSTDFAGSAEVSVLARQGNLSGNGLTVDSIHKVEYRSGSGTWEEATATDGNFNSGMENFQIQIPASPSSAQSIDAQDITIRITKAYEVLADGDGDGSNGTSAAPTNLDGAHAFPNPFKPNSNVGHVNVTFTGMTPGARVQIFTVSGEPVYDQTATASATTLTWAGITDDSDKVASGVYHYLITNDSGETKTGKIAVIK